MKKKIGFLQLEAGLLDWLLERLGCAPPRAAGAPELAQALEELRSGGSDSLLLELGEESAPAPLAGEEICCGTLCIQPRARRALQNGRELALTPKEFDILVFLARNRGQVFTKEQIYQAVWDGDYLMDDSNIMAFIRKLRKKVEPNPDAPEYILTIWGVGYKFTDALG